MKHTKEQNKKQVKFTIELDKTEWEHELDHVYEHQKNKFNVEGFRKGKAPRKVVEKQYGESIFYNDAIDECYGHYFLPILTAEKDLEIVGNPSLDVTKLDKDGMTFVVTLDLKPEVKLGDYKGLNIEQEKVSVSAKEVNAEIQKMAEKSARIVEVERPVKLGDTVTIDFAGYKDGVAFQGGTSENYDLEIGSGNFIAGFEDQIIGMNIGEERNLNLSFPEDYPVDDLKGAPVVFKVKLHKIKEKQVPEINDEFAKNVSEFDTLDEYKKDVKKDLLKKKETDAHYAFEEKLLNQVVDNCEVEIPESMIREKVDSFLHEFEHRLSHQGLNLEMYVQYMGTTIDKLKEDKKEDAKKSCKVDLVVDAIVKKENLLASEEDFEKSLGRQALKMGTDVEEVRKSLDENAKSRLMSQLTIENFFEFLEKNNKTSK